MSVTWISPNGPNGARPLYSKNYLVTYLEGLRREVGIAQLISTDMNGDHWSILQFTEQRRLQQNTQIKVLAYAQLPEAYAGS